MARDRDRRQRAGVHATIGADRPNGRSPGARTRTQDLRRGRSPRGAGTQGRGGAGATVDLWASLSTADAGGEEADRGPLEAGAQPGSGDRANAGVIDPWEHEPATGRGDELEDGVLSWGEDEELAGRGDHADDGVIDPWAFERPADRGEQADDGVIDPWAFERPAGRGEHADDGVIDPWAFERPADRSEQLEDGVLDPWAFERPADRSEQLEDGVLSWGEDEEAVDVSDTDGGGDAPEIGAGEARAGGASPDGGEAGAEDEAQAGAGSGSADGAGAGDDPGAEIDGDESEAAAPAADAAVEADAGGGGEAAGGGESALAVTPTAPRAPRATPNVGIQTEPAVDFDPLDEQEQQAVEASTGIAVIAHIFRSGLHLKRVRDRAQELQAEIVALAEGLAAGLDGFAAVHEGNIAGGVVSAKAPIGGAYSEGKSTVEAARVEAQGDIVEHQESAHAQLEATEEEQFQLLQTASRDARDELVAIEAGWTEPFRGLEAEYAEKYGGAAEAAANTLLSNRGQIQAEYDVGGGWIGRARAEKLRRHASGLVDEGAERIRTEGPRRAAQDIEQLGHAELIATFLEPLQRRVMSLETDGLATLDRAVAAGRETIDQGAESALEELEADGLRALDQLEEDEQEARADIDTGGEQLELDLETEIASTQAEFTTTAAAHADAYEAHVEQAVAGLEGASFLDERQVGEYAGHQVEALDAMASRHREELESLHQSSQRSLGAHILEGIEGLEATGREAAEQAETVSGEKAEALRHIAARYGQSLMDVSAGVAREMSVYVQPFGPQVQGFVEQVDGALAERRETARESLDQRLEEYEAELAARVEPAEFASEIDPQPVVEGFDALLRSIASGAFEATRGMRTSKSQLFAALRQIETFVMGMGVKEAWNRQYPNHETLEEAIGDIWRSGVRRIAWDYLDGNTAEAARLELEDCRGWFRNDTARMEEVLRSLDDTQREEMLALDEWESTAENLRSSLSGTDLDVTEALLVGNHARADAYRLRDDIDSARRWGDHDKLHEVLDGMDEGRREEIVREFHYIQDQNSRANAGADAIDDIDQEEAYAALIDYTTRERVSAEGRAAMRYGAASAAVIGAPIAPVAVLGGGAAYYFGNGSQRIDNLGEMSGTDRDLAEALIRHGSHHEETSVVRFEHERQREGGPNQENLERALMMSEAERHALRGMDDEELVAQIQAERAELLNSRWQERYGGEGQPADMNAAIEGMFEGSSHAELETRLNQELLASGTNSPAAVAMATELAIDGWGTDEDRLTRMWSGMTPDEAAEATRLWEEEFADGDETLHERLYGGWGGRELGWGSELSGDDARQQQALMMGDERYMTDEQRLALAEHERAWSIGEHRGFFASTTNREAQNVSDHWDALHELLAEVAEDNQGSAFDREGAFVGTEAQYADYRELCAFIGITAAAYRNRQDRIAGYVTGGIALVGAVVATILTAGKGAPLIVLALKAGGVAAATGAATMTANYGLRGNRYGWEEMAVDLGVTGVSMATAGAGKYFAPSKATLARKILASAGTGAFGAGAGTAFQDATWDDGFEAGLGRVFYSAMRGGASGALSTAVSESLSDRLGDWADESFWRQVAVEAGSNTVGNLVGETSNTAFDMASGRYQGTWRDAVVDIGAATLKKTPQELLKAVAKTWIKGRQAAPVQENEQAQANAQLSEEEVAAAAARHADTEQQVDEVIAGDEQASEALAAIDAEGAAVIEDLNDQIQQTIFEGPDGELRSSASQDEVQGPIDAVERQVTGGGGDVVDEMMEAFESIIATGDRVSEAEVEAGFERARTAAAAVDAEMAAGGQAGRSDEEMAALGAGLLGLSSDETAMAHDLTPDQVEDWQGRVARGEADHPTAVRQVANNEPSSHEAQGAELDTQAGGSSPTAARDDGPAHSAANAARLNHQLAAQEIAGGHAFSKHVIDQSEFTDLGIQTRDQFTSHIERIMTNPSATRSLRGERIAFWDDASATVVIRNPRAPDGGTAFRPVAGRAYFEGLR
jgi:ribosomal protein L29